MRTQSFLMSVISILGVLTLAACTSEVEGPTEPQEEDTPPTIESFHPANGAKGVPLDEIVRITFSEDMDTTTCAGNVELSECDEYSPTWPDERHLEIHHSPWPRGTTIHLMVLDGVTDLAGALLDTFYIIGFETIPEKLDFIRSEPENGQQNVPINTSVMMRFSAPVKEDDLTALTTVSDVPPGKTEYDFTLFSKPPDFVWIEMIFAEDLPAGRDIHVSIAPGAEGWYGEIMEEGVEFWFRTGDAPDTEPPVITSITPPEGSILTPGSHIEVMFNERIEPNSIDAPTHINAELLLAALELGIQLEWNEDGHGFRIPLPVELAPGLPIDMTFCYYADMAGNEQRTPHRYTATMAGTPDYCPLVDGDSYEVRGYYCDGEAGSPVPNQELWWTDYMVVEGQGGGVFQLKEYDDAAHTIADDWSVFRLTNEALQFTGSHETEDGGDVDWTVDPPATYLRFPVEPGSWSGSCTISSDEGLTIESDYVGAVIGLESLPVEPFTIPGRKTELEEVFWKDCWKVAVSHNISMGDMVGVLNDTIWYAPTIGRVRVHHLEGEEGGGWWRTETYRHVEIPD